MTQKRKHYSKQFKIDAVKLVTEQLYTVSIRFWDTKLQIFLRVILLWQKSLNWVSVFT
jgi:transposase-like protein